MILGMTGNKSAILYPFKIVATYSFGSAQKMRRLVTLYIANQVLYADQCLFVLTDYPIKPLESILSPQSLA